MTSLRRKILWQRARDWLTTYHPIVIAVMGSTGRSITAAAIEAVVATSHTVRRSGGVAANPVAVALAIVGSEQDPATISWYTALTTSLAREVAEQEPAVLILEIAATRPGDIDWVSGHLKPDLTVVTDVGTGNLELFVTKENSAHEMLSLVMATKPSGTIIVNQDDELVASMPTLSHASVITFGTTSDADVQLARSNRVPTGGFAAEIRLHQEIAEVRLPHLVARYQVNAAVAAMAVGHALTIPAATAAAALHTLAPMPGQSSLVAGMNGSRLLDDSRDTTPESMRMALETLRALPGRRRIAVLGDIDRLGAETERVHKAIGRTAAQVASIVIVVGESMRSAGKQALQLGVDVHHFENGADVGKWIADFLSPDDVLLVSGGSHLRLSEIVERLRQP